jgi:hypothetical protein
MTETVYATDNKKEPDSDFEIDAVFNDIDVCSVLKNDEWWYCKRSSR